MIYFGDYKVVQEDGKRLVSYKGQAKLPDTAPFMKVVSSIYDGDKLVFHVVKTLTGLLHTVYPPSIADLDEVVYNAPKPAKLAGRRLFMLSRGEVFVSVTNGRSVFTFPRNDVIFASALI